MVCLRDYQMVEVKEHRLGVLMVRQMEILMEHAMANRMGCQMVTSMDNHSEFLMVHSTVSLMGY